MALQSKGQKMTIDCKGFFRAENRRQWKINNLGKLEGYEDGLKKVGKNQKEIAELLVGVSPGTICRELKRNKGQKGYRSETGTDKSR